MAPPHSGRLGRTDRLIRLAIALVLAGFALACPWAAAQGPGLQAAAAIAALALGLSAGLRACPLYRLLGISTG